MSLVSSLGCSFHYLDSVDLAYSPVWLVDDALTRRFGCQRRLADPYDDYRLDGHALVDRFGRMDTRDGAIQVQIVPRSRGGYRWYRTHHVVSESVRSDA